MLKKETLLALMLLMLVACSSHPQPERSEHPPQAMVASTDEAEADELPSGLREHLIETHAGRTVKIVEWLASDGEQVDLSLPVVLFVHGTPGGWSGAADVFAVPQLQTQARLLSIDRLVWGGSAAGGVEPSLAVQADAVSACLEWAGPNSAAVLVGHSLGAPIIVRTAMDFPELVEGLVILAGSVDPALEKTTWYQALGRWRIIRWMLPDSLRLADAEIIDLREELAAMLPRWGDLKMPFVIVHGRGDSLVPIANVDFMERVLTNAPLDVHRLRKRGHFIPWKDQHLIAERITALIDRLTE